MADAIAVLLVEDDPVDAQLLRATLATPSAATYRIDHVITLADAVARLTQRPVPDVVLLDLSLPDSTGPATLDRLLARNGHVPIVVLTGLDDNTLASAAVEAGAQDYLVKGSITGEVMARVIGHAVDRHRLQAALHERAKEQAGLLAISQSLHRDLPAADLSTEIAGHLVGAMKSPSLTHATVTIGDATGTAGPSPPGDLPTLTGEITIAGTARGQIVVGYIEPDRPFIVPEEQVLVDSAAGMVADWLARQDGLEQLHREEERLRVLVSQLPGVVWTTDLELRITSDTGTMLSDLGIAPDDQIGVPIVDLLETDPPSDLLDRFGAALAGQPQVFEGQWNGRWWRNYLAPKHDAAGTIVGTVCLTLDITPERQHRELFDSERRRFQGLFVNATDAMILADDDGAYIDANPAACDLTGYDRDELLTLHSWDLAAGDGEVDAETAQAMWEWFLGNGTMGGEFPIRRKDGTTTHTDFRAVANIVPGVHLSTLRDITQRQLAEEALGASETRFRTMAESAHDAIYRLRLEPEVAFDYLNPAAETITGFPLDVWRDHPMLYVKRTHPDDAAQLDPARPVPEMTTAVKVRFQHADGHWIWLEDRRSPLLEDGRPVGVQGVIRDITGHEQAEQALRDALRSEQRAAERLRAVDDLKSSFLQAVSHELRTPLTSVLGYARTLVAHSDQLSAEQIEDFHYRLESNATRLDLLLSDLLDLERLDRGIVRLNLEPTDLTALATRTAATIDVGDRKCHIDDTPAMALVDPRKVERILHNLLANAVKHTPAGSTIQIACQATDEPATITVSDNGPGIAEADRDAVFEPFWQAPSLHADASPGTGIGLSLVRQLAALHGGRAWVEPRPGGGANFHVAFPHSQTTEPPTTDGNEPAVFRTVATHDTEEGTFRELMQDTVDQLKTTRSADEAAGLVMTWIQRVGGRLTPATSGGNDILDIDLSLGGPQRLRASAPQGSIVRRRLDNHLPFLLLHARDALAIGTDTDDAIDPDDIDSTTGILQPKALDRMLERLHGHDAIAVLALDPEPDTVPDDHAAMQHLTGLATRLARTNDRAVLTSPTELVLILPDTPDEHATALLDRIRNAWQSSNHSHRTIVSATAAVTTGAGPRALAGARTHLRA